MPLAHPQGEEADLHRRWHRRWHAPLLPGPLVDGRDGRPRRLRSQRDLQVGQRAFLLPQLAPLRHHRRRVGLPAVRRLRSAW